MTAYRGCESTLLLSGSPRLSRALQQSSKRIILFSKSVWLIMFFGFFTVNVCVKYRGYSAYKCLEANTYLHDSNANLFLLKVALKFACALQSDSETKLTSKWLAASAVCTNSSRCPAQFKPKQFTRGTAVKRRQARGNFTSRQREEPSRTRALGVSGT